DVESHRQTMKLGHDRVFEARALELLGVSENLRPDEAGDVVDDGPGSGFALNVPRDAVRSRLERHHVHAFGRSVGDRRTLAGFEVETVEAAPEVEDAVGVEPDHPRERRRGAGEALEPDIYARPLARAVLFDDIGEDTVARRERETFDDALEQRL